MSTDWLRNAIALDHRGFVLTGPAVRRAAEKQAGWTRTDRDPYLLETSPPGAFAAGDVRSDSTKRVAAAVGEGSIAVKFVHSYLAEARACAERRAGHPQTSASLGEAGMASVAERIQLEVLAWPGATAAPHRFGGVEFRLGRAEIGHLHGDRLADIPFPRRVRDELVAAGRARPHHVLPESGWVSVPIRGEPDVQGVLELLRLNYDRLAARPREGPARPRIRCPRVDSTAGSRRPRAGNAPATAPAGRPAPRARATRRA